MPPQKRAGEQLSEEDDLMRQKRLDGTPVTPESFAVWKVGRERFSHLCAVE
jgi:hypothetical protein